jgi:hypothetical protein
LTGDIVYVYLIYMRGRPPKPKSQRKDAQLHILLTEEEKRKLDKYAKSKDADLSAWARQTLLAAAEK